MPELVLAVAGSGALLEGNRRSRERGPSSRTSTSGSHSCDTPTARTNRAPARRAASAISLRSAIDVATHEEAGIEARVGGRAQVGRLVVARQAIGRVEQRLGPVAVAAGASSGRRRPCRTAARARPTPTRWRQTRSPGSPMRSRATSRGRRSWADGHDHTMPARTTPVHSPERTGRHRSGAPARGSRRADAVSSRPLHWRVAKR